MKNNLVSAALGISIHSVVLSPSACLHVYCLAIHGSILVALIHGHSHNTIDLVHGDNTYNAMLTP